MKILKKEIEQEFVEFELHIKKDLLIDSLELEVGKSCYQNDCHSTAKWAINSLKNIRGLEWPDFIIYACDRHKEKLGELR